MQKKQENDVPVVSPILWARMLESTQIYHGRSYEEILSRQSK